MNKIGIINACSDLGVNIDGTSLAPSHISSLLNKNLIDNLYTINKVDVKKEKEPTNLKKNLDAINEFNKNLFQKASNVLNNDEFLITIGGDHSVAIASSLASINKYNNLGIIWIDAHPDFNTFETTTSGNIHGLPLAAVCGYKNHELTSFLTKKYFNPQNVVVVGARNIDPLEMKNLENAGITIFTTDDVKREGIKTIMNKALDIATDNTSGVHISYDLDVIDPTQAPGVSIPVQNGFSEKEALEVMEILCNNIKVIKSLDLVEYNPLLDKNAITLNIVVRLLNNFINKRKRTNRS